MEVGWDTVECIYNIHILEKKYTRGYNCNRGGAMLSGVDGTIPPNASPNLTGGAESRTSYSFFVYVKQLHCSNTDQRWK